MVLADIDHGSSLHHSHIDTTSLDYSQLDDMEIIEIVRSGHTRAFAELFQRYRHAAERLARRLAPAAFSDDIVAETFAQVLTQLKRGRGPNEAFRAYLFTSIRHEAGRLTRMASRTTPTDDPAKLDTPVPFDGGGIEGFERDMVRAALESLPRRWRVVLWYVEVEGRRAQELAPHLELSPNGVAALVYRAREGFRKAYLEQHIPDLADSVDSECVGFRSHLAAYTRAGMSELDHVEIDHHLSMCSSCLRIYRELDQVNRHMGGVSDQLAAAASL